MRRRTWLRASHHAVSYRLHPFFTPSFLQTPPSAMPLTRKRPATQGQVLAHRLWASRPTPTAFLSASRGRRRRLAAVSGLTPRAACCGSARQDLPRARLRRHERRPSPGTMKSSSQRLSPRHGPPGASARGSRYSSCCTRPGNGRSRRNKADHKTKSRITLHHVIMSKCPPLSSFIQAILEQGRGWLLH